MRAVAASTLVVTLFTGCGEAPTGPEPLDGTPGPDLEAPAFVLALPGDSTLAVATTELAAFEIRIERREGFSEVVTFTASAPDGFVVLFRPTEVVTEQTDLLLVAGAEVAPGTHLVTITATASGGATQTATLTVALSPADELP